MQQALYEWRSPVGTNDRAFYLAAEIVAKRSIAGWLCAFNKCSDDKKDKRREETRECSLFHNLLAGKGR
jgi:hypothetical protein